MRASYQTVTGVGVSNPVPLDNYISPFNVGFGNAVTGTATYSIQHTFDDVFAAGFNPSTAVWYNHPTVAAQTTNMDGNYAFPVAAVRLNLTSGSGSVTTTFIQAGRPGN
jgi:hypothetical protein